MLHTTSGPAHAGDYVAVMVLGIACAKADASIRGVWTGQRLVAAEQAGHVRPLQTRTLEGTVVTEGTPVVGVALGPVDANTGLIPMLVTLR
jgi:hypothetical protein